MKLMIPTIRHEYILRILFLAFKYIPGVLHHEMKAANYCLPASMVGRLELAACDNQNLRGELPPHRTAEEATANWIDQEHAARTREYNPTTSPNLGCIGLSCDQCIWKAISQQEDSTLVSISRLLDTVDLETWDEKR